MSEETGSTKKRVLRGTVVTDKMEKTFVVEVRRRVKHRKYGKYMTRLSRLQVHDEENVCRIGDEVEVESCRPISKNKSFRLHRCLSHD